MQKISVSRAGLLTAALLCGLGAAQTSSPSAIPSLPPGAAAPAAASTAPVSAYPSGFTRAQLDAVLPLLSGLKTLQSSELDETRGRVRVSGLSAVDRLALMGRLREAGLPAGVVEYVTGAGTATGGAVTGGTATGGTTGTVTLTPIPSEPAPRPGTPAASTLPRKAKPLAQPHAANLSGPVTLRAGESALWSFLLKNTGTARINLSYGACDVRFEVIGAGGEIVRPDPKNTLCTMQLVMLDVAPGETAEVQKIRWDGKDASGQPVRPGTYTIRAAFDGPVHVDAAEFKVTVR